MSEKISRRQFLSGAVFKKLLENVALEPRSLEARRQDSLRQYFRSPAYQLSPVAGNALGDAAGRGPGPGHSHRGPEQKRHCPGPVSQRRPGLGHLYPRARRPIG